MAAPSLRPGGDRALGRFEYCDFPDEVAAPRHRANGRLIPSSVRHSRHAVSLDRVIFIVGAVSYVNTSTTSISASSFAVETASGAGSAC
jgi:hypothetical protein